MIRSRDGPAPRLPLVTVERGLRPAPAGVTEYERSCSPIMHRIRRQRRLGVAAALAWLLVCAAASPAVPARPADTTVVTVTLGKPTELGIKLSKSSSLPAGAI